MTRTGRALLGVALWLAAAIVFGAAGGLRLLPLPFPQVVLGALVALLLLGWARSAALRAWLAALPLDALVALHLSRFVGIWFLVLHARGELPYDFAVKGGWGDIAVASAAAALLAARALGRAARPAVYAAWNAAGLADILFVVATAARLGRAAPDSMSALLHLPLCLLPTFLVPLIIFTHLVLATRLPPLSRGRER